MLRNREFRRFALLFVLIAAVGVIAAFVVSGTAGILVLVLSATFGVAFFVFTQKRYRNLARISAQIDLVLHNKERMEWSDFDEGELSILHSEIRKMTSRIREQNDVLKRDRQYLSDSLADIAHQIRTPLTSAHLALSLLAKTSDEKERQIFIREMTGLFVQTDWLITSLLKLSRLDAGVVEFQNEPIRVADLLQSALRPLLIPLELRNIDVRTTVSKDVILQGDLNWLSEALENMLKNCMESVEERGVITVSCNETSFYTEIIIRDNGTGFAKEDLPYVFDRFYRGNNQSATGYGIGLALAKTIITRQDGVVTAKNHPEGGAVFSVRFSK